jgi:hypothetical protein
MAGTLRQLLIQRAARLQGRPAFTAAGWGTLSWAAYRNRVEGLALGLLSRPCPPGTALRAGAPGPWAWCAEVAAACAGLLWDPDGAAVDPEVLGGTRFNSEEGRGPYHDREAEVEPETLFHRGLGQGEVLRRLRRLNETTLALPAGIPETPEGRAALWSALYAGAHATLLPAQAGRAASPPPFDPGPFLGFWEA